MNNLSYVVPIIALIGLAYLAYRYINLFLKINKLENEFSSIVNHTFRTPLTRILWLSKELETDLPAKDRLSNLQKINNAADRILSIVDIIAGIRKIDDISGYYFEATSIREITEKSIEKYRDSIREKSIELKIPSFLEIPLLSIDLKKISFVIDALIENAILYTPKNGKITIGCSTEKKNILFSVEDTGIGLTFMDKLRIFSRFYRNKRAKLLNTDGMGLCLYLSKKIVKRHHGKIYAFSEGVNKGSIFYLKLPY